MVCTSDAGSQHVDELHGTLNRFYCNACHKSYTKSDVIDRTLKHCDNCGGAIRPNIVLYGEMLDQPTIIRALNKIEHADTLVVFRFVTRCATCRRINIKF